MKEFDLIATATFGLENVVARELKDLGYDARVTDGRINFRGDLRDVARCNLWLRSADRVLIRVGEFPAPDFGALFDQTVDLPWSELLPVDAKFPVKGRSVRSKLHAVPKVQGAVKKAIVESLKKKYNRFRFDESGAFYGVEVSLLKDRATLTIDTTGPGLHKRGYRRIVGAAPLRETMAAGLLHLSYWNPERPLIDPFCGTGTIPIEAALISHNIAPGLNRSFAAEDFDWSDRNIWRDVRQEARDLKLRDRRAPIMAFDHDPGAVRLARNGATDAGVGAAIKFNCQEVSELTSNLEYGCIVTNPPYGERLGEDEEVEAVYRVMGPTFSRLKTWGFFVLTSHKGFERNFGRRAERRRKLYNGRLECQYYQYGGPRPPRPEDKRAEQSAPAEQSAAAVQLPQPVAEKSDLDTHETIVSTMDVATLSGPSEPPPTPADLPPNPFDTFVADCSATPDTISFDVNPLEPQEDK